LIQAFLRNLAFDAGRYMLVALPAFAIVWWWGRERFRSRLIGRDFAGPEHLRRELWWSASTAVVFAAVGLIVWAGHRAGVMRVYLHVDERGWVYWVASIVALVVLHDAYFYWTHRAMHHPWLFRRVHRVHHLSTNPSPLAAYAFAPAEAVVQAMFVPIVALVLPFHPVAMFVFLVYMIARNVLGHLGVELMPRWFVRHRWLSAFTTTTHHAMHHRKPRGNYGLYFTFWDRLMGTTHADYEETFERVTSRGGDAHSKVVTHGLSQI
jgi:sterol desaturase/sphingolipid hydroxylase (fatty acid hydroxylase superfamily)